MRNRVNKSIALILIFLIIFSIGNFSLTVSAATPIIIDYDNVINTETAWIASLQLPSGAIPTYSTPLANYNNKYRIIPYFSNIACLGLLEKPSTYSQNVKKYMDWYFGHLNIPDYNGLNGTIYDYDVDADKVTEISRNYYDSTDSYAATFLSLLRKYYEVTGDSQYLVDHKIQIDLIGGAMIGTKQPDGLTFAKPDYRIKYLMDNSEVHKGFADIQWIYSNVFEDQGAAAWYGTHLGDVAAGIEGLWDSTSGIYRQYKDDIGNLGGTNMTNLYPDATAQLFPIWEEVIDPSSNRALSLYNKLSQNHAGWPVLSTQDAFPWAIISYTGAMMGDKTRVDTFLNSIKNTYIDKNHPWPWYCMESGMTILAAVKAKSMPSITRSIAINSPTNNEEIKQLPFIISGSSQGADKIEIDLILNLTGATKTVEVNTSTDGTWNYEVPSLLNGDYTITAKAKDKFNNIYDTTSVAMKANTGASGSLLTSVTLSCDKDTLRRSETAKLTVTGTVVNGSVITNSNLENATIEYMCSRPDLVTISSKGDLTLSLMDKTLASIDIWANATLNNVLVQSNHITINLNAQPLTTYDAILDAQAQYIVDSQLPSGAIATSKIGTKYKIEPRLANIAAIGLLERPEYAPQVKKYIDWYTGKFFAGMNWPDKNGIYGTAYDYEVEATNISVETSLGSYDTAASRIATFVSLIRKYYEVTGGSVVSKFQLDVITGGLGILKTQDVDGLSWAKPENKVKYLADNTEIYKGLKDSVWLFRNLYLDEGAAAYFEMGQTKTMNGIETKMWDSISGSYNISIDESGQATPAQWMDQSNAVAELSPIYTGLIESGSDRALSLYSTFNQSHPGWTALSVADGVSLSFIGYTSTILGDKTRSDAFLNQIKAQYIDSNSYPVNWSTMQAGITMLVAQITKSATPTAPVVDKTVLEAAIDNAIILIGSKTVGTAVGNIPQTAKDAFQIAITAATAVNTDIAPTQVVVDAQIVALATEAINFNNAVIVAPVVNKSALEAAISNATTLIGSKTVGTAVGNIPQTAKDALQIAITAATVVNTDIAPTQAVVDAQIVALATATINFNNAVIVSPVVLTTGNTTHCVNAIANAPNGSNVVINVTNEHVDKIIFDSIKGTDKTITFKQEGIEWVFNGKDITNKTKAIDLTVNVAKLSETTSKDKAALVEKFMNADVNIISFADNGLLPGKATVKVKLSSEWLSDKDKNNIYIYYYNKTTKLAELIDKGLKVDSEGYVQFNITHNSDYIVIDKELIQAEILPKTGSVINTKILIEIGILIALLGLATLGYRKKYN